MPHSQTWIVFALLGLLWLTPESLSARTRIDQDKIYQKKEDWIEALVATKRAYHRELGPKKLQEVASGNGWRLHTGGLWARFKKDHKEVAKRDRDFLKSLSITHPGGWFVTTSTERESETIEELAANCRPSSSAIAAALSEQLKALEGVDANDIRWLRLAYKAFRCRELLFVMRVNGGFDPAQIRRSLEHLRDDFGVSNFELRCAELATLETAWKEVGEAFRTDLPDALAALLRFSGACREFRERTCRALPGLTEFASSVKGIEMFDEMRLGHERLQYDLGKREWFAKIADQAAREDAVILKRDRDAADVVIRRTAAALQHMKTLAKAADYSAEDTELQRLKRLRATIPVACDDAHYALYAYACRLRRRVMLSHPGLNFDRLLINRRGPPQVEHQCDQYLGRHELTSPGLAVVTGWKDAARISDLTKDRLPPGSIMHPDLSYDAKRIAFAYCDHSPRQKDRVYTLYEIGVDGDGLRQLTGGPGDALATWSNRKTVAIEDFDPCYLPGGDIMFVSTRSQNFGRCHSGRYTPSYLLYRVSKDAGEVRQISFGEANEWDPAVLHDGRVVFTRWDYINRHDTFYQSLWSTRPDGTNVMHTYGNYTRNPCMTAEAAAIPGSEEIVSTAMAHHGYTAGSLIRIDTGKGEDGPEPIRRITPEIPFPETERMKSEKRRIGRLSVLGAYCTPEPVDKDLYFAAFTYDMLVGQSHDTQRKNAYAIFLVDTFGNREPIFRDAVFSCTAPIPIRPRKQPIALPSMISDLKKKTGTFYVQDVYNSRQPIEKGSAISLRINRILPQPTPRKPYLDKAGNEIIKGVVGTVPVRKDGSAYFEAPAGEPLQLQLLDKNGMAVMTMRTFIYLQPGEFNGCTGCHEPKSATVPMAKPYKLGEPDRLAPPASATAVEGLSFLKAVQPVLDRHCIRCHGLEKKAGKLDLIGSENKNRSRRYGSTDSPITSYEGLTTRKGLVKIAKRNRESAYSKPKDYFAHAGKLAPMLLNGHHGVKLDRQSFLRIAEWLDLNAQCYGDYSYNRVEDQPVNAEAEKALRAAIRTRFGAELAKQPIAALINVANPEESRILKAPLAESAGGWGQSENGWRDTSDPAYRTMAELVASCIEPLKHHDEFGTCGRGSCGSCWVKRFRQERLANRNANASQ